MSDYECPCGATDRLWTAHTVYCPLYTTGRIAQLKDAVEAKNSRIEETEAENETLCQQVAELEAENSNLREALQDIADKAEHWAKAPGIREGAGGE